MTDLFNRISELKSQGRAFCVITVVNSSGATPRKAGARALVFADGTSEGTIGGGAIETEAFKAAQQIIKLNKPLLKDYQLDKLEKGSMACGGSMTLFYEPVSSKRLLTIFGAGHVGRALARVAYEAGWSIRVVDDRDGIFDNSFFPKQTECVAAPYIDFIQNQQFSENDWLAIVTPKHSYDESVLRAVIASQAKYIGMMGSPKKVKEVMAKLNSDGIYENLLKKVYAPIGLNIGTETPSEIAIAIVGEMLALLHGISEIKFCSR